jgi:hypothetical protein
MSPASLPMYIHTPYSPSKHDKKVYLTYNSALRARCGLFTHWGIRGASVHVNRPDKENSPKIFAPTEIAHLCKEYGCWCILGGARCGCSLPLILDSGFSAAIIHTSLDSD